MKKIFIYFISLFVLNSFAANAQTPSVSLTITCPGAAITPGSNFNVDAAYGYSNVSGNLTVALTYNNTLVSFCGSPGFSVAPVFSTVGATTTMSYTFPASSGTNQTGAIQLCFTFTCPQTCFGTSLFANFTGNISSATLLNVPSNSCSASGIVLNNWTGENSFIGYECVGNTVSFRLQIYGSSCHKLINPSILISPSIGTLIFTSLGVVSGSSIILPAPLNPDPWGGCDLTYRIQLPCGTTGPAVLTCGAVLNGENCGTPVTNIVTLNNVIFNIPAGSVTGAELVQATYATFNGVRLYNEGNTPLTATLTTLMPQVKINRILIVTDQAIGLHGNLNLFDCANTAFTVAYNSGIPVPVTSLISKSSITIDNLLPGESCGIEFDYDQTASCTGETPSCRTFITSGSYLSYVPPNSCNCSHTETQVLNTQNTVYCAMPEVNCTSISDDSYTCKKAGDVVHICVGFENFGTAPILNGQITFPIPSYLDYSGNLSFNSSPLGISAVVAGGNLIITLPSSIGFYSNQIICFDATVNATAPNGLFGYYFRIRGDNLRDQTLYCLYNIRICEDPKVEIEKLVKGSLDETFTSNGTGVAGSIATYQVTVKNIGNTPIDHVEIIDRTPESGDKTIRTCTARGSQFSLMPNGVFNPVSLSSNASYAHSTGGVNQVPPAWAGLLGCDNTVSTFTTALNNTVKINLPGPIPAFTNYSFEMQVFVPSTATGGQKACNTVAVKSDYLDVAGNPHPLEIIESNLACLTIPVVPTPININCPNNQTESSCQSQSTINAAFAVWKSAFGYTGGCGTTATDLSGFTAPGNCGGSETITYTVTSTCGQTQSCTKTFTVTTDNTPPVITATGNNNSLGCNPTAAQIEAALGSATATDNCSVGTPTASDGPITGTCTKSQTRTWNVSDVCGNAATAVSRTVTWTSDTQKPIITATGQNDPLGCNPTAAQIEAALGSATATDNCSVGTPIASDGPITGTCTKSQTRTWNVSDACGNAATAVSRTITWTSDTQKPVITATGTPASGTLGCNPTTAQINNALGTATAIDNCGVGSPGYTDGAIIITGCSRSQTRTWNVNDACGNAATAVSRTVTWIVDLTPPVFTTCPQDINVTFCTNNNTVTYSVAASDNCSSPVLTFTFSGATTASGSGTGSGSLFLSGVTHVIITATDACGNIKTCSFNVTVNLNPEININICTSPTTTIYRGTTSGVGPLGPQALTLTSNITGGTPGYSYSWAPSTGLNNPNIANPLANPTVTTTYVLTVTDSKGCTRSLGITINVLPLSDAVCSGNGNNVKFNVCHIPPGNPSNPQNICISVNALPPHLTSGSNGHNNCYLGPCGQQLCFSTTPAGNQAPLFSSAMNPVTPITDAAVVEEMPTELKDEFNVQANPNPSTGDFIIKVFSRSNDPIMVRILDNTGVVRSVSSLTSKSNSIKVGGNLIGGMYIAEVTQGTNRKIVKLVKLN